MNYGQKFYLKKTIGGFVQDHSEALPERILDWKFDQDGILLEKNFKYPAVPCVRQSRVEFPRDKIIHANHINCGEFGAFIATQVFYQPLFIVEQLIIS